MNLKTAIAEDNRKNLIKIKMICESEFYSVYTASDGDEMNRIIDEYLPDVIITDLIMPRTHGMSVIRHARQIPDYFPVIIAISELRSDKYIDLCFKNGADYFISKPLNTDTLKKLLAGIRAEYHTHA